MRTLLAGLAAAALVITGAGCRTQPLSHPITDDFGTRVTPGVDMASTKGFADLTATTGSGCSVLVTCIDSCVDAQCQDDCFTQASSDAQSILTEALDCIYAFCLNSDGKRGARCVQGADGNFDDPPDGGAGGCNRCITNAYASVGGYDCMPSNDPDCNPSGCQGAVMMCLAE
jgi:hypothetical protein